MNVVILDTGCANLNSVKSAIARHGYEPKVSRDPDVVLLADKLFLPGVGTAQAAMEQVRERELFDLIKACLIEVVFVQIAERIPQLLQQHIEIARDLLDLVLVGRFFRELWKPRVRAQNIGWHRIASL